MLLRVEERHEEALAAALEALEQGGAIGPGNALSKAGWVEAAEQSFILGHLSKIDELLIMADELRPVTVTRFVRAHSSRFRARLAAARGQQDRVEPDFKTAVGMFRELGNPFWLAVTLLEHGEWLLEHENPKDAQPLLEEATTIFETLRAAPWLERLDRARGLQSAGRIEQLGSAS